MANLFLDDFDTLRQFIAANVNNTWDTIAPYIDEAEGMVLPILGPEMLAKLQTDLDASSANADHLALLKLVRRAQANFAYLLFSSDGTIQISDTGFLQVDEGGKKGAYQWQVREFKKARAARGWEALRQMLKLLMTNRDVYTEWSTSDTMAEVLECLVVSLEVANKHRRLDGFDTLWNLRPAMLYVQEKLIRANIGDDLYEEIAEEFLDDDLTTDNRRLLESYIVPAVVHLAIERASFEMNFTLSSQGLRIESTEAVSENSAKDLPAGRQDNFNVREDAGKKGQAALKELRKYLDANASASKYASYFSSDLYSAEANTQTFQNSSEGGSFWGI